jgi:Mg/Co/Ni transporter MgtE
MSDVDPLLLHFASTRPNDLAAALGGHPLDELTDFLASLPPHIAAPIVARIATHQLGELLSALPAASLGMILVSADHADSIAILSHLPASTYPAIVEAANTTDRSTLSRLFEFPTRTLSALASPDFVRVNADTTCGQLKSTLELLDGLEERPVFVVDAQSRYIGMLPAASVLPERNTHLPVDQVMRNVEPLTGQAPIASALGAAQWKQFRSLAVVDAGSHILGAVTLEQLERAVSKPDMTEYGIENMVGEIAASYMDLCADVLDLVAGRDTA